MPTLPLAFLGADVVVVVVMTGWTIYAFLGSAFFDWAFSCWAGASVFYSSSFLRCFRCFFF